MITGKNTNTVYLSALFKSDYSHNYHQLTGILSRHGIPYKPIKATKDIWCRDYMPIQINEHEFVQFRYEPSYLKEDLNLQSDTRDVCRENELNPEFSEINLDGGNIVNWSDRAVITDRVFDENPAISNKHRLISEIEKLLDVEVILIPQINSDETGHADGLIRFVDRNTVLGNERDVEYKYWKKGINKILKEHQIDYIDIPFFEHKDRNYPMSALGCYVNFLEVGNLIVIPRFEIEGNRDNEVYALFHQIYPDREIEALNFNDIGVHGGLLNCTTWTIKDKK